jgi:hypothetical protein|eukprot:CAMPEP_0174283594 /NCGR_PEP_ID=MMETSP0809-20121228/4306_1 /TAXON_ID=73025 ORGANISM="Eutreptiella gymnastica-like, Strain CCMP1594" /NCGR_SAMPLE_ID=MMETSP0809 /ASSEMBLY_ACC=CAM_ASM_000658 /LENGTH=227 /DNA_ID=CAMNT_0015378627 /DNA_START=63 /DNA_END=746 /DNA_ORIENTATION=+
MALSNVSYRQMEVHSVAEMLDPSRPLVKSQLPLTRPAGPRFVDPEEAEKRKESRAARKAATNDATSKIYTQRLSERKFLKAQYEFDREKRIAEQTIYRKEKQGEWKSRFATSPFLVDLVADNERIEEEMSVRQQEERRRQKQQELKKKKVKNEIIVKALSEVPSSEQARANKRMMYEEEKRLKALRDLERVDQLWERKQRDLEEMANERRQRIELAALVPPRVKKGF